MKNMMGRGLLLSAGLMLLGMRAHAAALDELNNAAAPISGDGFTMKAQSGARFGESVRGARPTMTSGALSFQTLRTPGPATALAMNSGALASAFTRPISQMDFQDEATPEKKKSKFWGFLATAALVVVALGAIVGLMLVLANNGVEVDYGGLSPDF